MSNPYRAALTALAAEVRAVEAAFEAAQSRGDADAAFAEAGRLYTARRNYTETERALRPLDRGPSRTELGEAFADALADSFGTRAEAGLGVEYADDTPAPPENAEDPLLALFGALPEHEPDERLADGADDPLAQLFD